MATTIYDIAEQAGVSTSTVSRVFNHMSKVKAETRQRVLEAARGLNYRPHASAQSLARQRTNLIAVVAPVVANHFYMNVMRGVQQVLSAHDFDMTVHVPAQPENPDKRLARATQPGRSDGLLLLSTPLTDEWIQRLHDAAPPFVLVDAHHPDVESIAVDNERGGYEATKHLIEQGYERIGHITAHPEPPPGTQRREGYEQALREAGLPVDLNRIAASDARPFVFAEEGGYHAMQILLERDPDIDAVFASSDMQALGALRAAEEAGRRVPEDLALVGFDDIELSRYVGLTTLRQPARAIGRRAAEQLVRRMECTSDTVSSTLFVPELIVRRSCGSEA